MLKNTNTGKRKIRQFILDRIAAEGPLQSRDFEETKKRGLWWDWKPAKEGLEYLFHTGRLMAKARRSFQKVYDLPEKVLKYMTCLKKCCRQILILHSRERKSILNI